MKEFTLGQRLRDKVTGFCGIATARVEYINGCVQYALAPPVDKEGKRQDAEYVDWQRLELVDAGVTVSTARTGGPTPRGTPTGYRG